MSTPFVHLHLHTSYSLLDGACRLAPLMEAVCKHGLPACARAPMDIGAKDPPSEESYRLIRLLPLPWERTEVRGAF